MLSEAIKRVDLWRGIPMSGRVKQVIGLLIESSGPEVFLGQLCSIYNKNGPPLLSEVVGFKEDRVLLMPFGEVMHIHPGAEVFPAPSVHKIKLSSAMVGRVLDSLGNPIDGRGDFPCDASYPTQSVSPLPLTRKSIDTFLSTGIKAIDALCPIGRGQRIGLFSKAGVGKSTLIGSLAKMADCDITVIALIGERGREVRDFIEKELGEKGLAKSVVVVATSDQPALMRSKGAFVATTIAEYFRDQGKHVLLLMDSLSRFGMAIKEIGSATGEASSSKGYPPSLFAQLPRLLERAGNSEKGSITGIYTGLCEDMQDPLIEYIQSLLDGHIFLCPTLAEKGHYPLILSFSSFLPSNEQSGVPK